ncbi:Os10g0512450, partial [Oryza sativa Japonica Group]
PGRGDGGEAGGARRGEAEDVGHVELGRLHPVGERPVEAVGEPRDGELERVEPQRHARARAAAGAEGEELEAAAPEVEPLGGGAGGEPRGAERVGVGAPGGAVAGDGPHVDHDAGAPGDGVAGDEAVGGGLVEEDGDGRVEAERLLDDAAEEGELVEVGLGDVPAEAHHGGELLLHAAEVVGAVHHLRHRPLDRRRHRLRPPEHHVL